MDSNEDYPTESDMLCTVDYGDSEGIDLDITLRETDHHQGRYVYRTFATGKTLGETKYDLDRMNLIASAVTKAFHSDGVHARWIDPNPEVAEETDSVHHFNRDEMQIIAESLAHVSLSAKNLRTNRQS